MRHLHKALLLAVVVQLLAQRRALDVELDEVLTHVNRPLMGPVHGRGHLNTLRDGPVSKMMGGAQNPQQVAICWFSTRMLWVTLTTESPW